MLHPLFPWHMRSSKRDPSVVMYTLDAYQFHCCSCPVHDSQTAQRTADGAAAASSLILAQADRRAVPQVSDTVVEPYNATLSVHQLVENADECVVSFLNRSDTVRGGSSPALVQMSPAGSSAKPSAPSDGPLCVRSYMPW